MTVIAGAVVNTASEAPLHAQWVPTEGGGPFKIFGDGGDPLDRTGVSC
jgi:hypothetical protein